MLTFLGILLSFLLLAGIAALSLWLHFRREQRQWDKENLQDGTAPAHADEATRTNNLSNPVDSIILGRGHF